MNHYISTEELYMYCHLYRYKYYIDHDWISIQTIHIIDQMIRVNLKGKKRDYPSRIKELIIQLVNKKYIESNIDEHTNFNDLIEIRFPYILDGYFQLDYELFDDFKDCLSLFIYGYILSHGDQGCITADGVWSSITGYSKDTIRKYIDEMCEDQHLYKIKKISGVYNPIEGKSNCNKYYIIKNKSTKRIHSWYDTSYDSYPDQNDFYVYESTLRKKEEIRNYEEKKLIQRAEYRIKALMKSDKWNELNVHWEEAKKQIQLDFEE